MLLGRARERRVVCYEIKKECWGILTSNTYITGTGRVYRTLIQGTINNKRKDAAEKKKKVKGTDNEQTSGSER